MYDFRELGSSGTQGGESGDGGMGKKKKINIRKGTQFHGAEKTNLTKALNSPAKTCVRVFFPLFFIEMYTGDAARTKREVVWIGNKKQKQR